MRIGSRASARKPGARHTKALTERSIAALKQGETATDAAPRGQGVLQVRKLAGGAVGFYYRYTDPDGKQVRHPLGTAISLADARKAARTMAARYQAGARDLKGALDTDHRERERQRSDAEAAAAVREARKRASLGALLTAYVEQLRRDGKASARAVDLALQRHVAEAWPKLWNTPAADVTTGDLLGVVAKIADAEKLREAAKVRSYLAAAYTAGIRARQDARGLPALRELRITSNPARDLATVDGANRVRERALSVAELRAYWQRIAALPQPGGALLRFHLLTGGQRIEQLSRLTTADHDLDTNTVRLRDTKGRRKVARAHDVPLIPEALKAMQAMNGGTLGLFLFTTTNGADGAGHGAVRHQLAAIVAAMDEAGELEKGPFTVGDLRRTVETRLAAAGVSQEIRAQLQSHGLGGVQARHYDRHDYLQEKRAALETLHRIVSGRDAKITSIKVTRSVA